MNTMSQNKSFNACFLDMHPFKTLIVNINHIIHYPLIHAGENIKFSKDSLAVVACHDIFFVS